MFNSALLFFDGQTTSSTAVLDTIVSGHELDALGYHLPLLPGVVIPLDRPILRCRFCGRKQPAMAVTCAGCGAPQ